MLLLGKYGEPCDGNTVVNYNLIVIITVTRRDWNWFIKEYKQWFAKTSDPTLL